MEFLYLVMGGVVLLALLMVLFRGIEFLYQLIRSKHSAGVK